MASSSVRATRADRASRSPRWLPCCPELDLPIDATAGLLQRSGAGDRRAAGRRPVRAHGRRCPGARRRVGRAPRPPRVGRQRVRRAHRPPRPDRRHRRRDLAAPPHRAGRSRTRWRDTEVRALATIALGGPLEGVTMQTLIATSGGNALFLRELIDGGLESGALTDRFGLWRLDGPLLGSPRLQDLIGQRLAGLPPISSRRSSWSPWAIRSSCRCSAASCRIETIEQLEGSGHRRRGPAPGSTTPTTSRSAWPTRSTARRSGPTCRRCAAPACAGPWPTPATRSRAPDRPTCCASPCGDSTAAGRSGPTP